MILSHCDDDSWGHKQDIEEVGRDFVGIGRACDLADWDAGTSEKPRKTAVFSSFFRGVSGTFFQPSAFQCS